MFNTNGLSDTLLYKCPCPSCRTTFKRVTVRGATFNVQGVEDCALKYIVTVKGIPVKEIVNKQKALCVYYDFNGKEHRYYPDFWIPSRNLVVEVKTLDSLGFGQGFFSYDEVYKKNIAKAKACIDQGFIYKMLVMDRKSGSRIRLPTSWYLLTKSELKEVLGL